MSKTVLIPKGSIPGKGYILTKNAAGDLVAIAPGANGTMLTPDSSTASGLAWAAVPSGGGTGNMNYRGTWQPTTPYAVSDAYVAPSSAGASAGELFVVTTAHTSGASFTTANATHVSDLLANDVRYRGTFAATTSYKQNDVIFQAGSLWVANADFTSGASFSAGNWTQIAGGSGMVNPMTTAGDIIVGGVAGAPTRVAKPGNNTVWGVDGTGTLGYKADPVGGGGGSAVAGPRPIPFVPGASYVAVAPDGGDHSPTTSAHLVLTSFTAGRTCTITSMAIRCRIGASAGAVIRFAMYSDTGGLPATQVGMTGNLAADVPNDSYITSVVSFAVTAGLIYWVGLKYVGTFPATPAAMAGSSGGGQNSWLPVDQGNPIIGAGMTFDAGAGNPPATISGLGSPGTNGFAIQMAAA
jgi:hypothetical protein